MASEGGAFDAAPPPVGGLGNFKGVMLCNRPSDEPKSHGGGDGAGPFKSMISATYSDQPGITPCKNFEPTVKKRGSSAALRRHVQWLKELQEQMRGEREQYEEEEVQTEERRKRMQAFFEKQREGVRQMLAERDAKGPLRDEYAKAPEAKAPPAQAAPSPEPKSKAKGAPSKPLWAMTEKEKEAFEEGDADSLINFAEGLDFDKYIGDLEFKQGMEALKDRAGKLQKEQNAFKDSLVQSFNEMEDDEEGRSTSVGSPRALEGDYVEGQSILGDLRSEYSVGTSRRSMGEERYNADGRPEWDGSTALGDERDLDRAAKAAAEVVLETNPNMRAIHSKESVKKIIERAKEAAPENLAEHIARDGAVAAPVITQSEDTQNRLHKKVDPSSLPYLYRSPAV